MPTPQEIMDAAMGKTTPKPLDTPKETPKPITGVVRNYRVRAGHDQCDVRGRNEEEAQANFFQKMGIRSTKHVVEIVEIK